MNDILFKAYKEIDLVERAIKAVRDSAAEDQKMNHLAHVDPQYREALNSLEVKLIGAKAVFMRIKTLGR